MARLCKLRRRAKFSAPGQPARAARPSGHSARCLLAPLSDLQGACTKLPAVFGLLDEKQDDSAAGTFGKTEFQMILLHTFRYSRTGPLKFGNICKFANVCLNQALHTFAFVTVPSDEGLRRLAQMMPEWTVRPAAPQSARYSIAPLCVGKKKEAKRQEDMSIDDSKATLTFTLSINACSLIHNTFCIVDNTCVLLTCH